MSKPIFWNDEKNILLKEKRGIGFEEIIIAMEHGHVVSSREHPLYENQKIFEVEIDDYIVLVPYVDDKEKIFLKTAFRSRKANKSYQKRKLP